MMAKKVLFITQEIAPYVPETEMSIWGRKLPQAIQEKGREIRTFMPKWGNINERRNQLHEVIRLSGMNLIINDTDHPLIIKVASIQSARMQVYFIDNDDYFQKRQMMVDENGNEYEDNDERAVFYARGVLETVKKLRWTPDIVHCHGWMTSMVPFYIKTAYREEPSFRDSKVIFSLYEECFKSPIQQDLATRMALKGFSNTEKEQLKGIDSCMALEKMAIKYSDGVIVNSEKAPQELIDYTKEVKLPLLDYQSAETYTDACSDFYDTVWGSNED